jgi:hypothetical protein
MGVAKPHQLLLFLFLASSLFQEASLSNKKKKKKKSPPLSLSTHFHVTCLQRINQQTKPPGYGRRTTAATRINVMAMIAPPIGY